MIYLGLASVLLWLGCCGGVLAAPPLESRDNNTCPFTVIPRYAFYCETRGWVQQPFVLSNTKAKTLEACANACQANKSCKSLRYVAATGTCEMYRRFLTQMSTITNNFKPGLLYDSDCFTTSCGAIAACAATKNQCTSISSINEYTQYACAYGFTEQTRGFSFVDFPLPTNITDACDAIGKCSFQSSQVMKTAGTFDVHFHIPSASWVCRKFHDLPGGGYEQAYNTIQQNASHYRYTLRNSTVGAGYGFFTTFTAFG